MVAEGFWWSNRPEERFWVEITQRPDIGDDLKAPQADKGGTRAHHAYALISAVKPGDIVFHYNNNEEAVTGVSRVAAAPFKADIVWGSLADGTTPFNRPGWRVPLEKFTPVVPHVPVQAFRDKQAALQQLALADVGDSGLTLHGPFQLQRVPLRMAQAYLTKMPRSVVELLPGLREAAIHLIGDLPTPQAPAPERLGQNYVPANEEASTQASEPFSVDPDVIDRGRKGHAKTQNLLAQTVESAGHQPRRPAAGEPGFDLAWQAGSRIFVAEVKSLTTVNQERQLRLGLGQVLRYRQLLSRPERQVIAVLAVERKPDDPNWEKLCDQLGVRLVWPGRFDTLLKG